MLWQVRIEVDMHSDSVAWVKDVSTHSGTEASSRAAAASAIQTHTPKAQLQSL